MNRLSRLSKQIAAGVALACAFGATSTAGAAGPDLTNLPDYVKAHDLGAKAYIYGVPLLNMEKTFKTQTSVSVASGRGDGPVNKFSHLRNLADPLDRTVVAPNSDTLYSISWLDLSREPLVVHTPTADRFHVAPFYSPYQENFANIGSSPSALPDGDYAITPPGWHGRLPAGLKRIRSPYDRAWVIVRIVVRDKADEPAVQALQDKYTLTKLSHWKKRGGKKRARRRGPVDKTVDKATIPGTEPGEDPIAFFDALGDSLAQFAPPAADAPLLSQLESVGIGPGLHPSRAGLSAATLQGLRDGLAAGRNQVDTDLKVLFVKSFPAHDGWLVTRTGNYGTDYSKRAIVDKIGLGALSSDIATYPIAQTDATAQNLTGEKRYVAHLPAHAARPPVEAFWSLTMYSLDGFFVPNAINRYLLNDRSDLHYNADGSLDFYFQRGAPTDPAQRKNWLPAPEGLFRVIYRLYQLKGSELGRVLDGSGWKPPAILPCLPTGMTATGVRCAR
jgi:hypothetical protein